MRRICQFLLPLLLIGAGTAQEDPEDCASDAQIMEALLRQYDKYTMPVKGERTEVRVSLWIDDVSRISAQSGSMDISMYMSELWVDPRLAYESYTTTPCNPQITATRYREKFWSPDITFIGSEGRVAMTPRDNNFVLLYPNGTVWTNVRLHIKSGCQFNLKDFPSDEITCKLTLESYSYSNRMLDVKWVPETPVVLLKTIRLAEVHLKDFKADAVEKDYPAGKWTELSLNLNFQRQCWWYLTHTYLPSLIVLAYVWLGFFFHTRSVTARTIICTLGMLSIGLIWHLATSESPRVSYVTKLDMWIGACVVFCLAALVETVMAFHCSNCCRSRTYKKYEVDGRDRLYNGDEAKHLMMREDSDAGEYGENQGCLAGLKNNFVDFLCIIIFPSCFAAFAVIYALLL